MINVLLVEDDAAIVKVIKDYFERREDFAIETAEKAKREGVKQFVALTRSNFTDEELQKYELEGRKSIEQSLGSLGIENMARESAARQLVPIVQAFGYKDSDITITFRKDEKNNTILRRIE